ncbi:DUF418 domain-containing protein [Yoonia sp. R2331]|uniref:DUF418 domain-containing protein n=1 Tax=Yoonia sp. R2331 TaxID=3237238 RepID=UPI0034E610CA
MTTSQRALMPDYLRIFALFGIVVVNVEGLAFPLATGYPPAADGTFLDALAMWLVRGLALLKSYGLFSFMFGVGLGFLMQSAHRRTLRFGRLYRNRIFGLLLLGVLHGVFFFFGDILVTYAVFGAVLYLFRNWEARRLVKLGGALLAVQIILALPLIYALSGLADDDWTTEVAVLTTGGFWDVVGFRSLTFAVVVPVVLVLQGIGVLGWFCLGLAAVKSGLIDNAAHPLWRRARVWCVGPGVALSLLGASIWHFGVPALGEMLIALAAPIATIGYLGLIAAIARPPGPVTARLLNAGGSSLSIYLGQSIILSTIFAPYGLDMWNAVGPAAAIAIAILVTIGLILFLSIWRIWFRFGPFEWVLRRITYAGTAAPPIPKA